MALSRVLSRVVQRAGSAVDRGFLRVMERRMAGSGPRRPPEDARRRLLALVDHYRPLEAKDAFFPAPAPPAVTETRANRGAGSLHTLALSWRSAYRPSLAAYLDEHARCTENLTARARLYLGADAPRPVAICVHGWAGGTWWVEERAFVASYWLRVGLDVALFQLPHHGERAPRHRRAGSMFPSPHVARTNEGFGQAIYDLRALIAHLRARGHGPIGAIGMSLGGYTTALLATVDDQLAFAIPMIPASDMAALMWRHGADSPQRRRAETAGVNRALLAAAFRVHSPLARAPRIPRERRMIVAGRGDQITPRDQAEALWRHWGEPRLHWFPGGHLAQVGRGDAFRAMRRHIVNLL